MKITRWLRALVAARPVVPEMRVEDYNPQLDGIWRGELKFEQGVNLALGIHIKDGMVTLESPNQGMFGREPTAYTLIGNTVSFEERELKASFEGALESESLKGQFAQGKAVDVELHKLDASDRERQQFEGSYKGDLIIDEKSTLPLQLNIAVVPRGYIGTLDSPAQRSYLIPLKQVVIDGGQVSFQSPMLNASYSASFENGAYEGTFVQGMERPLILKKITSGEQGQASVPKPKAGDHGGALAVITQAGVKTQYYADHDAQTRYEIGSNTKTMVTYLLAKAIVEGKIKVDAELTDYWPKAPKGVTLVQLASHHSGLPRLPENLLQQGSNVHDPYAGYGRTQVQEALVSVTPGEKTYLYSNFGFGVLGETLALAANSSFSELLTRELLTPLNMQQTDAAKSAGSGSKHLAQGFDAMGNPVAPWHFDAMAGAGSVVSTLDDMVKYVQVMMQKSAAKDSLVQLMLNPAESLGDCGPHALGWMLEKDKKAAPSPGTRGKPEGLPV